MGSVPFPLKERWLATVVKGLAIFINRHGLSRGRCSLCSPLPPRNGALMKPRSPPLRFQVLRSPIGCNGIEKSKIYSTKELDPGSVNGPWRVLQFCPWCRGFYSKKGGREIRGMIRWCRFLSNWNSFSFFGKEDRERGIDTYLSSPR